MSERPRRARVSALREWAQRRIAECRKQERKFSPDSDAMIEAATERRTLQAAILILNGDAHAE